MSDSMIVSGNENYGLASSIKNLYPKAYFASRSTDWNLSKDEVQNRFVDKSLDYSIYISCSAIYDFNQVRLLEKLVKKWKEVDHEGRIVVIGSSADTPVKGTDWIYPIEKKALKAYCRNLSNMCLGGHGHNPMKFRITYLSVGHLDTTKANEKHPEVDKLNLDYVAGTIKWVLDQPFNVNINEISLDPIQKSHKL